MAFQSKSSASTDEGEERNTLRRIAFAAADELEGEEEEEDAVGLEDREGRLGKEELEFEGESETTLRATVLGLE